MSDKTTKTLWDRRVPGSKPDISFIVPCKNEERYLAECLYSIKRFAPIGKKYEIILVDNGSTDNSVAIADQAAVDVALLHSGRIGHGRNIGAQAAQAGLYAFIDADVCLTSAWQNQASVQWEAWVSGSRNAVWGSWYSTRPDGTWVEKSWFAPLRYGPKTHMNGGHLIIRSEAYWQIGGFPPDLETGEDYELSMNAKAYGIEIDNDECLEAVHLGYPQAVRGFFARELWHGRGDVSSIGNLLHSKTALASVAAVHVIPLSLVAGWLGFSKLLVGGGLLLAPVLSVAMIARTFGARVFDRFWQKFALGLVYVVGRGLAPYAVLARVFTHRNMAGVRK